MGSFYLPKYCFFRLVNGVIEKTRRRDKSIADAAEEINIPRMLIDVRHGKYSLFHVIFIIAFSEDSSLCLSLSP